MFRLTFTLAMITGCASSPPGTVDPIAPDLTEALEPGQARAGVVTDEAALFGGVSAEGRLGDVKIYNTRARFVIQGIRDGSYYLLQGGVVIDADVVRDEGQPGRDVVDEFAFMPVTGLVIDPTEVTIVNDGADGSDAVVRVTGTTAYLDLFTGSVESTGVVPWRDFSVVTTYTLAPESVFLDVHHSLTWQDDESVAQLSQLVIASADLTETYRPGFGLAAPGSVAVEWTGVVSRGNEVALGMFAPDGGLQPSPLSTILGSAVGPMITASSESIVLSENEVFDWDISFGVAPDIATLTSAWAARNGAAVDTLGGLVDDGTDPVPGARVHLLDDLGDPVTMAVTDADGRWETQVPAGSVSSAVATGRGYGLHVDLPPGAGWYSPYTPPTAAALTLASVENGSASVGFADGYGLSAPAPASAATTLSLTGPGTLEVSMADGLPAVVQVSFAGGDPSPGDEQLVPGRPGGHMAVAHIRDGETSIPVEPGEYHVLIHRGIRYEIFETDVTVASGQTVLLPASLELAYETDGAITIDPHSHGAPSMDANIPMEDRLVTHAAHGVQVHVGTDHDHATDYSPLVEPLGLTGVLASVPAVEISPVLRGHFNAYPMPIEPEAPNNGSPMWWARWMEWTFTDALWAEARVKVNDGILQANHPDDGLFTYAGYNGDGFVSRPDFWTDDFDALELLNSGSYRDVLPHYLDLIARGYEVTPTGVSDSHGHRSSVGESLTFLYIGSSDVADFDHTKLVDAMRAHATVVSRGPFIAATIDGAWAPGVTFDGTVTLQVEARSPSWMTVDRLILLENGAEVDSVNGPGPTSFDLAPADDAFYVVLAEGDSSMWPVYGDTPWAATAAIKVDLHGNGWTAPKDPMAFGPSER